MATKKRKGYFGGKQSATVTYKWNALDSNGVANSTLAAHPLGIKFPIGTVITNAFYDVITTFTSAADGATISFGIGAATDLKTATAISVGTTYDDIAATVAFTPISAATSVKLSAEAELTATVAVEALTEGELTICIEYWVP